jgi:shikimate dehydrogenase
LSRRHAAVLGKPIAHSLSPVLHRAAYAALGLDWDYRAIECEESQLAALLEDDIGSAGFSCTMPLKRQVLRLAHTASAEAAAIGAGNTLLPRPTGWHADNTDWIGIRDALTSQAIQGTGRVLLLGAGGTAQAALAALPAAAEITVGVRDPGRTEELRRAADRLGVSVRITTLASLPAADLVISSLPPGAADSIDLQWQPAMALLDAVYAGWPTVLAARASAAGACVVSGAAMLLFQAARQVELMTGRAAPIEAMRAAMLAAVPGCSA